jgi:hypothetical protein
MVIRVFVLVDW